MSKAQSFSYDMTVIMPVYNAGRHLARAVASLDGQTFSQDRFEVILVNDGSTDDSPALCQELASQRDNYLVINQENQGVSAARNAGIRAARGRYLMFLDPDDELSAPSIQALVQAFDSFGQEVDLVTYPLTYHDVADGSEHSHKRQEWLTQTGIYDLQEYPFVAQTTINVCVRNRGETTQLFSVDHTICEDQRFNCCVLAPKAKLGYCAEARYVYWRFPETTASTRGLTKKTFDNIASNYELYLQLAHGYPSFARYAHALVLYEVGWRFRQRRLLFDTTDEAVFAQYCERIGKILAAVPRDAWEESPYLTGMWVIDWALRQKDGVVIKGACMAPPHLNDVPFSATVAVGEKNLPVTVVPAYTASGQVPNGCSQEQTPWLWRFSCTLPPMGAKSYEASFSTDGQCPMPRLDLSFNTLRCNGRTIRTNVKEFTDRRVWLSGNQLHVGTVKNLPAWTMPLVMWLMRQKRDQQRGGNYDHQLVADLRKKLRREVKAARKRRIWLYVGSQNEASPDLALQQMLTDLTCDDGAERWYVAADSDEATRRHPRLRGHVVERGSWEHTLYTLSAQKVFSSDISAASVASCGKGSWDRLSDFTAEQTYVLLTSHDVTLERTPFDEVVIHARTQATQHDEAPTST